MNPQAAQSFPPPQSVLFGLPRGETDSLQARAGRQGRAAHRRSQLRSVRGNRYVGLLNVTERLRVGTALSLQQEVTRPGQEICQVQVWPQDPRHHEPLAAPLPACARPPPLLFLSKTTRAILGPLHSYVNFKISLSVSTKKLRGLWLGSRGMHRSN